MSDLLKYGLLIVILALLTIFFGSGFKKTDTPAPEPNPFHDTIDAAHKAASQLGR